MKRLEIDRKYTAWLIGTGLVLFAVHNRFQPGIEFAFLPIVGFALSLLGMLFLILSGVKLTLGSKWIYIPLLIIVASMAGQVFIRPLQEGIATLLFGGYLLLVYIASRAIGEQVFKPFAIAVIVTAISCVINGIIFQGVRTGGIVSPTNYDMATGLLVFGALVSTIRGQWIVVSFALVGLVFTGAEEAIFAVGVIFIVVVIRRDWSKKLLLPVGILAIILISLFATGIGQQLYSPTLNKLNFAHTAFAAESEERDVLLNKATGDRWINHWRTSPIKPLGHGYNITNFYMGIPHNIVLIIIEQVGIAAALAWLFVTLYCLVKTRWKYAFIGILALGVFDHFIWTQVAPWWWCLVGVASVSLLRKDYIFRKETVE